MKGAPFFPFAVLFLSFSQLAAFAQQAYTDAQQRLRLYADDETQTVLSRSAAGFTARVIADDGRYVQKEYDARQRLVKETIFVLPPAEPAVINEAAAAKAVPDENTAKADEISKDREAVKESGIAENPQMTAENTPAIAENPQAVAPVAPVKKKLPALSELPREPTVVVTYYYDGESSFPARSVATDFAKKLKIEQTYTGSSLPVTRREYALEGETERPVQTVVWMYDAQNRPLKKTTTSAAGAVSTIEYVWRDGYARPDTFFFENGIKTAEYTYAKNGTLSEEKLFFAGGVSIATQYKDGKRAVQMVMNGDKVVREQRFD